MHYSEIRAHNNLEGLQPYCDDGSLEFRFEDVPHVNDEIFGPQLIQGGGDPVLGWGHEFHDHHNGVREAVINQG